MCSDALGKEASSSVCVTVLIMPAGLPESRRLTICDTVRPAQRGQTSAVAQNAICVSCCMLLRACVGQEGGPSVTQ